MNEPQACKKRKVLIGGNGVRSRLWQGCAGITGFCNLTDFQLGDLKAISRANRQKMHEKYEHPKHHVVDSPHR